MAAKVKSASLQRSEAQSRNDSFVDAVFSAAANAFVIVLLGRIAYGLVSGVAGRMVPSPPPGFAPGPGSGYISTMGTWWEALFSLRFKIFFAAMFLICLRAQLATAPKKGEAPGRSSRWQRIGQRFSENWFGSLIGNAFLAMALAMALAHIPDFGFWKWSGRWLMGLDPIRSSLEDGPLTWLNAWLAWYDSNKLKFNFWLIYFAAVCDDFGIPNIKSLARWSWRHWQKRKVMPAGLPADPDLPK